VNIYFYLKTSEDTIDFTLIPDKKKDLFGLLYAA